MDDHKLLELSAKAASTERCNADSGNPFYSPGRDKSWHLQANNGNALRLAVNLRLNINALGPVVRARRTSPYSGLPASQAISDEIAAYRPAIVLLPVIGRAMP